MAIKPNYFIDSRILTEMHSDYWRAIKFENEIQVCMRSRETIHPHKCGHLDEGERVHSNKVHATR